MLAVRVRSRYFNGRQPSGLGKSIFQQWDESSSGGWGGWLMHWIKIPQQEFALKMQGGLMREGVGGVFVGHYGTTPFMYMAKGLLTVTVL